MMERRHQIDQRLHQVGAVVAVSDLLKRGQMVEKGIFIELERRTDKNLLIICLAQAFLIHQQLLIQLFAGAKACELDFDIAVRDEARQLDEVFSQIQNFDRVAPVSYQHLHTWAAAGSYAVPPETPFFPCFLHIQPARAL